MDWDYGLGTADSLLFLKIANDSLQRVKNFQSLQACQKKGLFTQYVFVSGTLNLSPNVKGQKTRTARDFSGEG